MPDTTARLTLPLIMPSQAQKHVTHNEAILKLDALTAANIRDRDLTEPPASPADGDLYIIASPATGDWAGKEDKLAYAIIGGWRFYDAPEGLTVWLEDEAIQIIYLAGTWQSLSTGNGSTTTTPMLGINTNSDAINRLAVSSNAILFNHSGNGMQAKINKNLSTDPASLVFQTGFSGRAELGTIGNDDLTLKTSADGLTFNEAWVINAASAATTIKGDLIAEGVASKPGGGSWTATSDIRTKKAVRAYTSGLTEAVRLIPKRYRYNGKAGMPDDTEDRIGLIAQDVEQVLPEAIYTRRRKLNETDKQPVDVMEIDPSLLVYVLINAIKELDEKVTCLEEAKKTKQL